MPLNASVHRAVSPPTFTIRPHPAFRMYGAHALHIRKYPTNFVFRSSSSAFSSASSKSFRTRPPGAAAQLTRISTLPSSAAVFATSSRTARESVVSTGRGTTVPFVDARISAAACSSAEAVLEAMTTATPSAASLRAVSLPIPTLPPVTMATFPVKPRSRLMLSPTFHLCFGELDLDSRGAAEYSHHGIIPCHLSHARATAARDQIARFQALPARAEPVRQPRDCLQGLSEHAAGRTVDRGLSATREAHGKIGKQLEAPIRQPIADHQPIRIAVVGHDHGQGRILAATQSRVTYLDAGISAAQAVIYIGLTQERIAARERAAHFKNDFGLYDSQMIVRQREPCRAAQDVRTRQPARDRSGHCGAALRLHIGEADLESCGAHAAQPECGDLNVIRLFQSFGQ